MLEILPPYKIETLPYQPGMSASVQPPTSRHRNWITDYEYYDQLGRDPLQVRRIWGIEDPETRVEKLKELLEDYPKHMHRRRILLKATSRGDEAIVQTLVDTGMNVHFDAEKVKQQEAVSEEEKQVDDESGLPEKEDESNAPVHLACVQGHFGCLKIFLASGVDVDLRDEFGRTLLFAALFGGKTDIARYLLDKGADPTVKSFENELTKEWMGTLAGGDCLEATARRGHDLDIINLIADQPDVEVTLRVIHSVMGGHQNYKAFKLLLLRGGFAKEENDELVLDESNEELRKLLTENAYLVAQEGDLESAKLVFNFVYPEMKNGDGFQDKFSDSLRRSFVYGAYTAIGRFDWDKFEWIYNMRIEEHDSMSLDDLPEGQHLNIQHLFDEAAQNGHIDNARLLIEKYGADPNKYRLPSGMLPLYYAAGNDKHEMVRFLLDEHHVDMHLGSGRFSAGPTALWIAIREKCYDTIRVLLEHGGPLDEIDEEILNIDGPLDAILMAQTRVKHNVLVKLRAEENIARYINSKRQDYSHVNSPYVRLKLTAEDKSWIDKLQIRELGRLRQDWREYSKREADPGYGLGATSRAGLPDEPIFEEREEELGLNEDEELMPAFEPAYVRA